MKSIRGTDSSLTQNIFRTNPFRHLATRISTLFQPANSRKTRFSKVRKVREYSARGDSGPATFGGSPESVSRRKAPRRRMSPVDLELLTFFSNPLLLSGCFRPSDQLAGWDSHPLEIAGFYGAQNSGPTPSRSKTKSIQTPRARHHSNDLINYAPLPLAEHSRKTRN